ncbi:MAG: toprim domain-containing protein [Lautropia sp.]
MRRQFDRARVDALAVLASCGFSLGKGKDERRSNCPACDGVDCFSFSMQREVGQCLRCGIAGDAIALRIAVTGERFIEVVDAIDAWADSDGMVAVRPPRPSRPAPEPVGLDLDLQRKQESAAQLWSRGVPLAGTVGERYLLGRGCLMPPNDGDLRFVERVSLFGFDGPALVGRITRTSDVTVRLGAHLTWLEPDGSGRRERRYLGAKSGGVVRLWSDEAVTLSLGIAEGLETALAAAHVFAPMWACLDAGNLAEVPVLDGIEALTVFADNDESGTGQAAALACADRWLDAGREVRVLMSDTAGKDILDEVAA